MFYYCSLYGCLAVDYICLADSHAHKLDVMTGNTSRYLQLMSASLEG